ncbi:MAG TPA: glutamine amidotransferase [Verrucomicrobiae bacterium]|nr:glutamine amidotransferase [Verrucomicrobiae bacterium]
MTHLASIVFAGRDWIAPAVVLFAVIVFAVLWSFGGNIPRRRIRSAGSALKILAVALLLLALLEPLWVSRKARPGANVFGVIADNSQSMKIKDATAAASRGEQMRAHLTGERQAWQTALEEHFQVRRYTFDARLEHTRDFQSLTFEGRASALTHALATAADQWRGQPVAGVLLFTDGNATDWSGELSALEDGPPIYPVVSSVDARVKDVALEKAAVSQTAFEDAPVTFQAHVKAHGYNGDEIVARLTEVAVQTLGTSNRSTPGVPFTSVSNVVAEATQRARSDAADAAFRFQVQPDKPGMHLYEMEVRSRDDWRQAGGSEEATLVNNRRLLLVDRGQEPFRVLYVAGRPNWEYKFLNRAIQEDHQVHMVSLIRVARREPKFEFKGRAGESSNPLFRGFDEKSEETARYDQPVLVRLNTRDELELRGGFPKTAEELFQYHAVVLDDVEAEFFTRDQMSLLQRFVSERGGGFLMLGGAESFREGNYAGTAIATLLPVYVDRSVEMELPSQLRLTLTREGWLQPWARLRPTESEERTRLEALPAFEVFNPVRDIKPGASVLATVSDPDERKYPALVVQRFGLGRSAALTIGDFWRWGLRDEEMQKDLGKSWRQLVRWLVADVPSAISVSAEPANSGSASEILLRVRARDAEFKPLDAVSVTVAVRQVKRSGSTGAANGIGDYVQLPAELAPGDPGTYEATFIAREAGAYLVEASVKGSDGTAIVSAATGWVSEPDAEEFRSLELNRAVLETLAKRTGGEVIELAGLEKFTRQLPSRRAPVMESTSSPMWHRPEILLFALACLMGEWGLRRWKGWP